MVVRASPRAIIINLNTLYPFRNSKSKQRMSGADVEPLVSQRCRIRDGEAGSQRERGEEIREVTVREPSAFHLVLYPSAAPPLPLPSRYFLTASLSSFVPPAVDLVSGFVFFNSLHLVSSLALSLSSQLPWLQHRSYMKCICRG